MRTVTLIALMSSAGVVMVLVTIAVHHARAVIDGADRWLGPDNGAETMDEAWGPAGGLHHANGPHLPRPAESLVLIPDLRDLDDQTEAGRRTGTD